MRRRDTIKVLKQPNKRYSRQQARGDSFFKSKLGASHTLHPEIMFQEHQTGKKREKKRAFEIRIIIYTGFSYGMLS